VRERSIDPEKHSMFDTFTTIIALIAVGIAIMVAIELRAPSKLGKFSGKAYVIDGDTLAFGNTRVRIFGIDAPEMSQQQGPVSREYLAAMLANREIVVRPISKDRYGRIVARVSMPDGTDIGKAMVAQGYALAYTRYGRDYAATERRARKSRAGIWASGTIQNGSDWRRTR